jgi:hypothetical protein
MVLLNSGLPCSETPGDRARGALWRQGCQHPTTTYFSFLLFCPSTTARIGGLQSKCCFGRLRGLRGLRGRQIGVAERVRVNPTGHEAITC